MKSKNQKTCWASLNDKGAFPVIASLLEGRKYKVESADFSPSRLYTILTMDENKNFHESKVLKIRPATLSWAIDQLVIFVLVEAFVKMELRGKRLQLLITCLHYGAQEANPVLQL